jgi:hypothetical protein
MTWTLGFPLLTLHLTRGNIATLARCNGYGFYLTQLCKRLSWEAGGTSPLFNGELRDLVSGVAYEMYLVDRY